MRKNLQFVVSNEHHAFRYVTTESVVCASGSDSVRGLSRTTLAASFQTRIMSLSMARPLSIDEVAFDVRGLF